ncbi:unnamed protein product (plasmid) [Mycetohabitans rhizoxinica HKI 454]|uniref:Uncharacterized protein n=1 Tax=Mycetohabitans rhizoxinica (strain DSM 19002 / CIP 109453 / HKI 454) TaxID=882378 RepID=E5AUJ3_MYCRK|nr:unnamed protein product [Mycetohabitans rhizoxinica HKI 454]
MSPQGEATALAAETPPSRRNNKGFDYARIVSAMLFKLPISPHAKLFIETAATRCKWRTSRHDECCAAATRR